MAIASGKSVFLVRSSPTKYQKALYFVARTVRSALINAFFYHRVDDQLGSGKLNGVDYEQARFSSYALFDAVAVDISKLLEKRKDAWNLQQLASEWKKHEKDPNKHREVTKRRGELESNYEWLSKYRHEKVAHQGKRIEMTMLTALPPRIRGLDKVVEILDLFVDGEVPYTLYLHENGVEINLRAVPGLIIE
jgi:hypothetical protein